MMVKESRGTQIRRNLFAHNLITYGVFNNYGQFNYEDQSLFRLINKDYVTNRN